MHESCTIIKGQCIPLDVGDERLMSGRVIALETTTVPVGHGAVIKSGLAKITYRRPNPQLSFFYARKLYECVLKHFYS
jgi:hypothetical protein